MARGAEPIGTFVGKVVANAEIGPAALQARDAGAVRTARHPLAMIGEAGKLILHFLLLGLAVNRTIAGGSSFPADRPTPPECGTWVCSPPRDGVIRVRAGTLDDTSWLRPTRHIWTRSKQPWITFAEGDQIFDAQPPA
jgi:hypothetical protein